MPLRSARSTAPSSAASSIPDAAAEHGEVELRPDHRGQLEHAGRGRVEPGQALAHHLAHRLGAAELLRCARQPGVAVGDDERAGLDERPPELDHQERVALGEVVDGGRERRAGRGRGRRPPPARPARRSRRSRGRSAAAARRPRCGAGRSARRRARPACPPRGRGTWPRAACARRRRRGRGGAGAAGSACPTSARPRARRSSGRRCEAFTRSSATAWWRRWRSVS